MKKFLYFTLIISLVFFLSCKKDETKPEGSVIVPGHTGLLIINHENINLSKIPVNWVDSAKANLHIAYQHTSHGSQLISGMSGLEEWKGAPYQWNDGPSENQLDIDDTPVGGDLGSPNRTEWATRTRDYLDDHTDVNVIIWSWCGQVSDASEEDIRTYLDLMNTLEVDYPNIAFVYMTGHLDGSGVDGNLNVRNEQIRVYCEANKKILYDFADIESYDPDGKYYLDKALDDELNYDSNGDGRRDSNWGQEWQNAHTVNVDWYECSSAHSEAINANIKAYAAWWLWARLAGWNGQ